MNNIFDLLVKKLLESLYDLNMGKTMSTEKMQELWTLLHHLHYASYDSNSEELLNGLLEYYE